MKIIAIRSFGDKTTGETYKEQVKIKVGDVLECDDELANERIKRGFAKEYIEVEETEEVVEETEVTEPVEETEEVVEEKPKKSRKKSE